MNLPDLVTVLVMAFALGIASDYLTVRFYVAVYHHYRLQVFCLSVAITLIVFFVIASFVRSSDVFVVVGYALGNGCGAVLGMHKR